MTLAESPTSVSHPSLRRSLLLRLLFPLLALFAISGFGTYWLALHYANQVYDAWLFDSANSLAFLVDKVDDHATCDLPVAAEELFLWDETDNIFFSVRGDRSGVLVSNADLPQVPEDADLYRTAKLFSTELDNRKLRVIAIELSPERAGEHVWIQVAETGTKRVRLAQSIFLAVLLPQIALILAAFAAVNFGVTRSLRPLARLSRKLRQQTPTSLHPIPDGEVPKEVLPLTHAVNVLLAGLQQVLSSQRKFVADAAHQLRTPLTGIKLQSERAIKEYADRPSTTLETLRVSADRAARLANQLLTLARAESGLRGETHTTRIDVLGLARERGADWVLRALAKDIELSLNSEDEKVFVLGDALLICEVLDNFLDNAIKYHGGGGQIVVAVSSGTRTRISVEDDGPGIAPELRARVYERFDRGARFGHDGNGLGLSIVAEIAAALKGRTWIEAGADGRGTRAVFELPGCA